MGTGLHIVAKKRKGKPVFYYVYAWRGGPQISMSEGVRPKITAALTDLAADKRREIKLPAEDGSLLAQITLFKASAEFTRTAASTQANYLIRVRCAATCWTGVIAGSTSPAAPTRRSRSSVG